MKIQVNGEERDVTEGLSLLVLLKDLGLEPGRLACEVNGRLVRRAEYPSVTLRAGDGVEIVQMIGGG